MAIFSLSYNHNNSISDINCPYCKTGFNIEHQDSPAECDQEKSCLKCGKRMIVRISVMVYYRAVKPVR